jgi:Protein of unknown function (DUF2723)
VVTRLAGLAPLLVGIVVFAAARAALLPGLGFWDTAEYQAVGPLLGTAHPTGFPTYVLLGWLASVILQPLGDPAARMNLLAAICLAVAAGATVALTRTLTQSVALGVMAGLAMALAPAAWAIGTHAETHALHLAFIAILLLLLVGWEDRARAIDDRRRERADRWLIGAAFVLALSVGNHSLTLLLVPPVALFVLAVDPSIWRRPRLVARCGLVLAVTLLVVYLELPLRAGPFHAPLVYGRPDTWDGFWYVILAEQFHGSVVDPFGDLGGKFVALVTRAIGEFGPFGPLIPLGFIATAIRRPRYALLTGAAAAITCFFASSYVNADIGRYFLVPWLIAWTWLAILGSLVAIAVASLVAPPDARFVGGPSSRYRRTASVVAVGAAIVLLAPTLLAVPARYRAVDEGRNALAAHWVDHALAAMPHGSIIVSWWSYSTPLWYAQLVEGKRPDLVIKDDRTRLDENLGDIYDVIDKNLGVRSVFVIRDDPKEVAELARRYELQYIDGGSARSLTRVIGPRRTGD